MKCELCGDENSEISSSNFKPMTQEDIDRGLEEMFKGQRRPDEITPQKKPTNTPRLSFEPEPEPEPEEESPYWDGKEWEQWAYSMYKNYPETRKFLPNWFIEAIQEALRQ